MKTLFAIFGSCFVLFANAQTTAVKQTTVFYNSFSWSPDGTTLCFSVIVMDNGAFNKKHWELGSINIRTKKMVRITDNDVDDDWPAWSPDGKKLVFQSERDGNSQLYVMDADGNQALRISNNTFNEIHPAWSPDGKKIMFLSNRDGNQEIYTMNPDGLEQTRLTNSAFKEFNPQWSPNGQKIVYYYEKGDNKDQLYIADKNGNNSFKISSDTTHNYYPSWLPDGNTIIYAMNGNLWKMNIERPGEKSELLPGVVYAKYAPDGKKIAFKKGGWPSAEIWICNSDGSNPTQLTDPQKMTGLFAVTAK